MKGHQTAEERLGAYIRELRISRGMSQSQLVEAMTARGFAWARTTPSKTESAERPVRWNEVVALAEVLDVKVSDLAQSFERPAPESPLLELLRADAELKSAHVRLEAARREISEAEQAYEAAWQKRQAIQWSQQS